jgi:hypothetical protein
VKVTLIYIHIYDTKSASLEKWQLQITLENREHKPLRAVCRLVLVNKNEKCMLNSVSSFWNSHTNNIVHNNILLASIVLFCKVIKKQTILTFSISLASQVSCDLVNFRMGSWTLFGESLSRSCSQLIFTPMQLSVTCLVDTTSLHLI